MVFPILCTSLDIARPGALWTFPYMAQASLGANMLRLLHLCYVAKTRCSSDWFAMGHGVGPCCEHHRTVLELPLATFAPEYWGRGLGGSLARPHFLHLSTRSLDRLHRRAPW